MIYTVIYASSGHYAILFPSPVSLPHVASHPFPPSAVSPVPFLSVPPAVLARPTLIPSTYFFPPLPQICHRRSSVLLADMKFQECHNLFVAKGFGTFLDPIHHSQSTAVGQYVKTVDVLGRWSVRSWARTAYFFDGVHDNAPLLTKMRRMIAMAFCRKGRLREFGEQFEFDSASSPRSLYA